MEGGVANEFWEKVEKLSHWGGAVKGLFFFLGGLELIWEVGELKIFLKRKGVRGKSL